MPFKIVLFFINVYYKNGQIQIITHNNNSSGIDDAKISLELKIQNITLEVEGEYVCEVLARSGHTKRDTYTLKIFSNSIFRIQNSIYSYCIFLYLIFLFSDITDSYIDINLTVYDGKYNKIRRAGFNKTTWTVDISHELTQSPKW
jgi:hypothetical protein